MSPRRLLDWIDDRSGVRALGRVLLDEPLPPGTGWLFTLGSILLALLAVQVLTGVALALYYAPTPDHAHQSIQFIDSLAAGRLVRGLHHYGASFIVVAAALHMLRVVVYGAYRAPREVTWLSGLALLLLILAFALTGYLLPWDQRAYWATVVTINIARLAPLAGDFVAGVLQGGPSIGALTLTRWYAVHVIVLPAVTLGLVVLHLAMMRRHGISGPLRRREGQPFKFYPFQAARDVTVVLVVLGSLTALAAMVPPGLDAPADPTDTAYVPRPEWYFLWLFQVLKYFPGRWEVVGAIVLPTIGLLIAVLLPWIDGARGRSPRERAPFVAAACGVLAGILLLTALARGDASPRETAPGSGWSLRAIGGKVIAEGAECARCHGDDRLADPLDRLRLSRPSEWMLSHVLDPEVIAPGLREPPSPMSRREAQAIVAYLRTRHRSEYPEVPSQLETAGFVFARFCVGCHTIDGDGGDEGPDLSAIGREYSAAQLREWITDPEAADPDATMPSFGDRLTPGQLDAISEYLATRK